MTPGAIRVRNDRRVDGFLLLDKPTGITSNAALQRARRVYRAQRAGHTGTLDPMAAGLLPVCFGEATKFAGELLEADKAYRAGITLGVRTSTADAEGEVVERRPVDVSEPQVREVLERFRGDILQVPPMHSALKRDGVPLYVHARKGRVLEREARPVTIHALDLLMFAGDHLEIDVSCSKGTYIRVLAEDIGAALGCGAHLASLVRTRIGPFRLDAAHELAALEGLPEVAREPLLLPLDSLLGRWPEVRLGDEQAQRFGHGQPVALGDGTVVGPCRVYAPDRFLGTGTVEGSGSLRPKRLINLAVAG
jgi:tRNA pseudouridine55 synthase